MATGACGINCDVCQLNLLGHCSSCGPGRSVLAARKSAAQQRLLGHPCAILECARLNHIDFCPRDCPSFPCDNFTGTTYPFGQGFLQMQRRRRQQGPPTVDPAGRPVEIAPSRWDALAARDLARVAGFTLTDLAADRGRLQFAFLNRTIAVDPQARCLMQKDQQGWVPLALPLLELIVLDYLSRVTCLQPLGRELVATDDLADALYFSGPSRLRTSALLSRYGDDPEGFKTAGRQLGGHLEAMADVALRLTPFPRIPVYYLLWCRSREFPPRLSILFDRSIEQSIASPSIWSLVTLCSYYLIRGSAD